jgi:hypothetical protein
LLVRCDLVGGDIAEAFVKVRRKSHWEVGCKWFVLQTAGAVAVHVVAVDSLAGRVAEVMLRVSEEE